MINQETQPNGSMEAFASAFSNLVKDATSHLATKDDLANMPPTWPPRTISINFPTG